jgi:hypothetical protein
VDARPSSRRSRIVIVPNTRVKPDVRRLDQREQIQGVSDAGGDADASSEARTSAVSIRS